MANTSLNYDKYLDYLKTTQRSWRLFSGEYPKTVAQHKATYKALKESTVVEKLKFLYSAECKEDFIDALRFNNTLKILEIHGLHEEDDAAQILHTLAAKQHLINFNLRDHNWHMDLSFKALIAFITNNKTLQTLSLPRAVWTADRLSQLLLALKTCPNLTKINLGDLYQSKPSDLAPLVEYLNSTPAIQCFEAELDAEHSEYLNAHLTESLSKYAKTPIQPVLIEDEPLTLEGNAMNNFWDTLPKELTKHILYEQLNIRDLVRFITCSKVTLGLAQRWKLWKEYYLKHFSCVTAETLELINVMEGHALLNKSSIDEVWPRDPWQLMLKYTFTIHSPSPRDFPRVRNLLEQRLMGPVYQLYPQLIGCASARYEPKDTSEQALGISNPTIHYTWFGTIGAHTYSLGFDLLRDGTINVIMLYHYNTQHSTKEGHWQHLFYVFDWFTTKSVAEFQIKVQPLVNILLTAQESSNYHYWPSKNKDKISDVSEDLKTKIIAFREKFTEDIVAEAKSIARKYNPQQDLAEEFAEFIYDWVDRVKQYGNNTAVPDYVALKQVLTPKTVVNEQWANAPVRSMHYPNIGQDNETYFMRYWSRETKTKSHQSGRNRPKKRSGLTAVTILIRTVINLIVMPLLKSFWPPDMADPNYRLYSHFKGSYEYEVAMSGIYKYGYTSLEHVSVSHAQPQAWPAIAVAVAQLIMRPVCRVIEAVIDHTWTNKQQQQREQHENQSSVQSRDTDDAVQTRVNELIGGLMRIGLIPHEHITMLRKLFEELSTE